MSDGEIDEHDSLDGSGNDEDDDVGDNNDGKRKKQHDSVKDGPAPGSWGVLKQEKKLEYDHSDDDDSSEG